MLLRLATALHCILVWVLERNRKNVREYIEKCHNIKASVGKFVPSYPFLYVTGILEEQLKFKV